MNNGKITNYPICTNAYLVVFLFLIEDEKA
jgi:hypothetical protein